MYGAAGAVESFGWRSDGTQSGRQQASLARAILKDLVIDGSLKYDPFPAVRVASPAEEAKVPDSVSGHREHRCCGGRAGARHDDRPTALDGGRRSARGAVPVGLCRTHDPQEDGHARPGY